MSLALQGPLPTEASDTAGYDEDSAKLGRSTAPVSGTSCEPEAGRSCDPSDSEGRVLRVTSTAWKTLQRSRMKVSRTTSLDSHQRISHLTSYASITSGRRGAVPVSRTRSADSESFDSQESPASEKFSRQIAHSLYSLDKVATPPSSELGSVGRGASPTNSRNELPQNEAELMTSKLIRHYSHHLLSLIVTTPNLRELQRLMNLTVARAIKTWRMHSMRNKFCMCSTDVQRVMNSTLAGAFRTWKRRTADTEALERRRIKVLEVNAVEHLHTKKLSLHFAAWQGLKKQVQDMSQLQDSDRLQGGFQDGRRGRARALIKPSPGLAGKKGLATLQSREGRPAISKTSSAPVLDSETGHDFIRNIFSRIHKSRNAYQVLVCPRSPTCKRTKVFVCDLT